jgi:putative nucleotidyltransferase with HDIG domain
MDKKKVKKTFKKKSEQRDAEVISLKDYVPSMAIYNLAKENNDLKQKQKEFCEQAVRSILHALDCKDHYTYGHSMRVTYYSLILGKEIGMNEDELYELEMAALFHDIGKIAIPDSVLLKPSRLNEDEFLVMKTHPEKSSDILQGFKPFEKVAQFAKHHHERFDGRGYPDGLKGEEIPLCSRIILITDTFDAMTSSRPYRKGLDFEVAYEELSEFAGSQFDPYLVENFCKAMRKEEAKQEKTFTLNIIDGTFVKNAA